MSDKHLTAALSIAFSSSDVEIDMNDAYAELQVACEKLYSKAKGEAERIDTLKAHLTLAKEQRERDQATIRDKNNDLKELKLGVDLITSSFSYRLGQFLTAPLRYFYLCE